MKNVILKLNENPVIQHSKEGVRLNKLSSSISPINFIKLVHSADNKVNPRSAKDNKITKSINETLETNPELFFFKSKGILVATESCRLFDRNRVELSFDNEDFEGIMDGGHNTLAIATFLLKNLFEDSSENFSRMNWQSCKDFWVDNYDEILTRFKPREKEFEFSIPIELIFPNGDSGSIDDYYDYLNEICSARNNNVQLSETAKGNQSGNYDFLKEVLGYEFDVIWKSGEPGKIKSEDVISLATIPLMYIGKQGLLPKDVKNLNKISVYSQKSKCIDFFNEIMAHEELTIAEKGKYVLNSPLVRSSLEMTKDILYFFDWLYLNFPDLYNGNGGAFGKITCVNNKKSKVPFNTTDDQANYQYPYGFLYPLICGLTNLMEYDSKSDVIKWRVNPRTIKIKDLNMELYVNVVKLAGYDPQKVGKNETFYLQAEEMFNKIK